MNLATRLLSSVSLALVLGGCVTAPQINWAARVGNYTFDQAVTELGPPDKQARLTDGATVAEWLMQRGRSHFFLSTGFGYGWPYYGSVSPGWVDTTTSPDWYLRLTFAPDGKLSAWKRFAR